MSELNTKCPQCGAALPGEGFAGLCPHCVASSLHSGWDITDTPQADAVPLVEGWQLVEPIGAGGQGIVWRGVRVADSVAAAVKIFRLDRAGGWEAAARMELESGALAKLDHPGIVRVLGSGETDDEQFFIAMEFVDGCDLHRLLRAEKMGASRALAIAENVADAIAHAHERGVVHRDLKPANVLIGRSGVVKLVDFSLARRTGQPPGVTMTRDGTVFGTPYYLAPEVMRGGPATAAADLYALGVMLYEMLTGAPPAGRFARVSEKCGLPREADTLIESLLAEEPDKRPRDASETARELKRIRLILAGFAQSRTRRQRLKLAALIALIAGGAAAAGYLVPRPQPVVTIPKLNAKNFPNPAAATRAEPFVNGLGMQFVPVPGLVPLVCRHETKMADFLKYVSDGENAEWHEAHGAITSTRAPLIDLRPTGWEPMLPAIRSVNILHSLSVPDGAPACGISFFQAERFCAWLTWRDQREGRLGPGEFYRLPTDDEWSLAAGLPRETEPEIEKRHKSRTAAIYPWSGEFSPPPGFANYGGTEVRDANWPANWLSLKTTNDDFPRVAPVGSFAENEHGLFDIWGNVWEWCDTRQTPVSGLYVLRGASCVDGGYADQFRRDFRRFERPIQRYTSLGFRCVLVVPGR